METMARDSLFRNLEEWIDEYGIGNICCIPVWVISKLEGSVARIFDIVGPIVKCDDVYTDILFESELWTLEEVL
jgi:hypothetical protein